MEIMIKAFQSLTMSGLCIILAFSCNTNNKGKSTSILESNNVLDFDSNSYQTVVIGKQTWMKENLKVTHFRNGDPIPNITDSAAWIETKKGAYCNYNNDTALSHIYGRLYNWYAVNDERNICPVGWHIPSIDEFSYLDSLFGGFELAGMQLKEIGTIHWEEGNNGTNASNFTALPGGTRVGVFGRLRISAFFWNKEEYLDENCSIEHGCAYECSLTCDASYFLQDWGHKNRGMSVRCIKDTKEIN